VSGHRRRLLARAHALADLAAERSEAELLRAVVWLELRAAATACAGLLERIAVQYWLLAEHPEVRPQPGLARRYADRAWNWAEEAAGGPSLAGRLARNQDDA
jgi:hypothetical protein